MHSALSRWQRSIARIAWSTWNSFVLLQREDDSNRDRRTNACKTLTNVAIRHACSLIGRALSRWIDVIAVMRAKQALLSSAVEQRSFRSAQRVFEGWKRWTTTRRHDRRLGLSRMVYTLERRCRVTMSRAWHAWLLHVSAEMASEEMLALTRNMAQLRESVGAKAMQGVVSRWHRTRARLAFGAWRSAVALLQQADEQRRWCEMACTALCSALERCVANRARRGLRQWVRVTAATRAQEGLVLSAFERQIYGLTRRVFRAWHRWTTMSRSHQHDLHLAASRIVFILEKYRSSSLSLAWRQGVPTSPGVRSHVGAAASCRQ